MVTPVTLDISNLITEPEELDVALNLLADRGIHLNRLVKELDKTAVAFWYWRKGVKPVPRYVAIFFWTVYRLGKRETRPYINRIRRLIELEWAIRLIKSRGQDITTLRKVYRTLVIEQNLNHMDEISPKLARLVWQHYKIGKQEVADFIEERKSATPAAAA